MIGDFKVFTVIPARGGSTRLKRKNIYTLWEKPMIYWAIEATKNSKYIDKCFVSTEDNEISTIVNSFGINVIQRPAELADNYTYKQEAVVHAVKNMDEKPDIVVSLQANSPQVCSIDLDGAIKKLVDHDRNEIFSVSKELLQNAAFRIMKYEYVFQKSISTRSGVYIADYIDVHNLEDVANLENNFLPC